MARSFSKYLLFLLSFLLAFSLIASRFFVYLNQDSAGLVYEAARVHGGELLNRDFIEINPPLIVYMMLIPVYLHDIFHISLPDAFTIFMALLLLPSLALALPRINNNGAKLLLIFLAIFPMSNVFGQREHIFIILILPYFVALWDKENPSPIFMALSGLMAGIGFCIKPYFVVIWAGFVLLKMLRRRKFFSFLNLQDILVGACLAAYVFYLIFVEQEYVSHIVPFLLKYYSLYTDNLAVYSILGGEFVLFEIPFLLIFWKDRKALNSQICITNYAFFLSMLVMALQSRPFLYYFYPISFFGALMNIFIIIALKNRPKELLSKVAVVFSAFAIIFYVSTSIIATFNKVYLTKADNFNANAISIYNKYASGKPIYFLGADIGRVYSPALPYSNAYTRTYYGAMWPLHDMYKDTPVENGEYKYRGPGARTPDEDMFVKNVMADLKKYPPAVIIVEDNNMIATWPMNYLHYFELEPEFNELWKNYRLEDKIVDQEIWVRKDL